MCDQCPDPSPTYCEHCKKYHLYSKACVERLQYDKEKDAEFLSDMIDFNYQMKNDMNFAHFMYGFEVGRQCHLYNNRQKLNDYERVYAYKKYTEMA